VIGVRYWSVLLGVGTAGIVGMAIPLGMNSAVITQYLLAIREPHFFTWVTPTFGAVLRKLFGWEKIWLQFIPPLLGTIWFLYYWSRHRRKWEWGEQMPLLLLVSLITAAFGWGFDQVVLLVVVVQVTVWILYCGQGRIIGWAIAPYLGINYLPLIWSSGGAYWFIWVAPSLLLWYWAVRRKIMLRKG